MSFISMMEAKLPPGFRFHPRDDELICDYLAKKISGDSSNGVVSFLGCPPMIEVDLNKCEPWDLPERASCVGGKEWYFFSLRDRKYATGQRTNRATASGYWKATGKDRHISRKGVLVGMRKTLVFYQGRAPKGKKSDWVMHEFRMETTGGDDFKYNVKEDWVLCRIFYKSRGVSISSKPSMDTNNSSNYHEDACSNSSLSLLPSLEKYISFGLQTPTRLEGGYEQVQVPCFSNSASASPSALPPNNNTMMAPPLLPTAPTAMPTTTRTQLSHFGSLNQSEFHGRDKKKVVVIRSVLNQKYSWEPTTATNSNLGQGNSLSSVW